MMRSNISDPVVVEQLFKLTVEVVWSALTSPVQMRRWFFENIPAFEPKVGFQTSFEVISGDRSFTHRWKILEVVLFRKIRYHWSYEEYEGEGQVTFELFENDNGTLLRLTNEGLDSFPATVPEFRRESCESGWKFLINNNLKEYLEK